AERFQERRLSGVALAEDHVHGARLHLEVEIPHGPPRSLSHGEPLHPEPGSLPHRLSPRFPRLQSGRIFVPARPSSASRIFPGDVIVTQLPAPRTYSSAAWILGPMLPGGKCPSASQPSSSDARAPSRSRCCGFPKWIATRSTPVTITSAS